MLVLKVSFAQNRRLVLEGAKKKVANKNLLNRNLLILIIISTIVKFLFFVLSAKSEDIGFSLPISEAWKDYAYAYVPAAQAFKNGSLPYKDFYYAYPPPFLYILTLFSFIPYFWSAALPLIISDILTVIPVYLIGRRFLTERYAFISSLLFALAPINLSYVDYVWLNPSLTTLFLMLSIYLLLEERYGISAFSLALSIGFKQTSIFAFPIILFYLAKKLSQKEALRYLLIVAFICLAFSIPYLFVAPKLYLFSMLRLPIDWFGKLPENYFNLKINFSTWEMLDIANISAQNQVIFSPYTLDPYSLKMREYVGLNAPISLPIPILVYLLPELPAGTYIWVTFVLIVLLVATYGILLYTTSKKEQFSEKELVRYSLYGLLIFFTLYPIYKYYIVGVTPLLSLFIQNKKYALIFIVLNFILLIVPRIFSSYVVLLALIWILRAAKH
jgi:4-amino-4-deoxy-L-arabinose transferase-like glycosyltransferase